MIRAFIAGTLIQTTPKRHQKQLLIHISATSTASNIRMLIVSIQPPDVTKESYFPIADLQTLVRPASETRKAGFVATRD
jgi:hypothetical protein